MTPKERAAMQQALDALCNAVKPKHGFYYSLTEVPIDCAYKYQNAITALREALGNSLKPKCFADYQPNHAIDRACASCAVAVECQTGKQAEQSSEAATPTTLAEPVAWMDLHKELGKLRWMGGDEGWDNAINAVRDRLVELATTVRTKDHCNPLQDLTEEEIEAIVDSVGAHEVGYWQHVFARAVIAADRAKNNLCERTK